MSVAGAPAGLAAGGVAAACCCHCYAKRLLCFFASLPKAQSSATGSTDMSPPAEIDQVLLMQFNFS